MQRGMQQGTIRGVLRLRVAFAAFIKASQMPRDTGMIRHCG